MPWAAFAIMALVVIVVFLVNSWLQKQRTDAWRQVAEELGIAFLGGQSDLLTRCAGMTIFSCGSSRRVTNAISGDAGNQRITLADYRYSTGSGKSRSTHSHTICVLQSDSLSAPHCYLRPEIRFVDAIGSMLGGQDIDFTEDAAFSRAYVLQGEDETAIRKLFDADVRSYFAGHASSDFHFEARGNTLVFHTSKRSDPREAKQLMQQALEIVTLLSKR